MSSSLLSNFGGGADLLGTLFSCSTHLMTHIRRKIQVHMDSGLVTEETGGLPYPAADFVWKPVSEDFIQDPNKASSASGPGAAAGGANTTTPVPSSRNDGRGDGSVSRSSSSRGSSRSSSSSSSSNRHRTSGADHRESAPRSGGRRVQFEGGGLTVDTGASGAPRRTPASGGGYGAYPAPQVRGGYRSQADAGINRTPSPHDQGRRAGMGSSPRSEESR